MAQPRKEFTIRKLNDPGQQDMMIARLHQIWSDESQSMRDVDLAAYNGLDLFWEQAPVVEEDDEKQKEIIQQNEELTKLDGKKRQRAGFREPRWVLRDTTRRKAERRARKEAEQKGVAPPHDPRLAHLKDGGLIMLGTSEGILKAPNEANQRKKTTNQGDVDDSSRANYAVMIQTGDDEVSIANLSGWLTFRGPHLIGTANAQGVSRRVASFKRDRLKKLLKEGEASRTDAVETTKVSGPRGGSQRKRQKDDNFDGYDDDEVGTGAAYFASEVLNTLQQGGAEEEADNEATVRSDDEAGSDGRDDTRTFDVNNQDLESSDESDEDAEDEEDELDEEHKLKLLAKLRANKKTDPTLKAENSDVSDDEKAPVTVSKSVQYLALQKSSRETGARKRARDDDAENETANQRSRAEEHSTDEIDRSQARSPVPLGSQSNSVTESEVRGLLEQGNGRIKTKDLRNHFKKRISTSESAKQDLIAILNHLVVKQNDEVEGMMYVLKGRQFS